LRARLSPETRDATYRSHGEIPALTNGPDPAAQAVCQPPFPAARARQTYDKLLRNMRRRQRNDALDDAAPLRPPFPTVQHAPHQKPRSPIPGYGYIVAGG